MPTIKTVHGLEDRQVVSQDEWVAARLALLNEEKELTRRSDEIARRRQSLPWVKIEKDYRFETQEGKVSLADLFKGARNWSSTTSCSGPATPPGVRPARRRPTVSMGFSRTWRPAT